LRKKKMANDEPREMLLDKSFELLSFLKRSTKQEFNVIDIYLKGGIVLISTIRTIGCELMKVDLFDYLDQTLKMIKTGTGVLLVSIDSYGCPNVMTIGLLLLGHWGNPIAVVAVRPATYTFKLLEEVEEFVIAVPIPELKEAVAFCGEKSGRDTDKFRETGLTPIPSVHVKPPSIKECMVNIECRIYDKISGNSPLSKQHTIYFAEVLGVHKY